MLRRWNLILLVIVYIEMLNLFDPELQLINIKLMIKKKLKELLSELKKFKVQSKNSASKDWIVRHRVFEC